MMKCNRFHSLFVVNFKLNLNRIHNWNHDFLDCIICRLLLPTKLCFPDATDKPEPQALTPEKYSCRGKKYKRRKRAPPNASLVQAPPSPTFLSSATRCDRPNPVRCGRLRCNRLRYHPLRCDATEPPVPRPTTDRPLHRDRPAALRTTDSAANDPLLCYLHPPLLPIHRNATDPLHRDRTSPLNPARCAVRDHIRCDEPPARPTTVRAPNHQASTCCAAADCRVATQHLRV